MGLPGGLDKVRGGRGAGRASATLQGAGKPTLPGPDYINWPDVVIKILPNRSVREDFVAVQYRFMPL